jgi:hypothetical protein
MTSVSRLERYRRMALEILRQTMGPYVRAVTLREDDDNMGEPSLFFVAEVDAGAPINAPGLAEGQVALARALKQTEDEFRFPYLKTESPEGSITPEDFRRFRDEVVRARVKEHGA